MRILFKFATRSRPKKYCKCIINIIENIVNKSDYKILVSADADDATMNNPGIIDFSNNQKGVCLLFGESKNKVTAINRDMENAVDWDILINTSDDMQFVYPAFDNAIRDDFSIHFPDLDGVLHYNDSVQGGNCMSMTIMGRKYYERFNYIYWHEYQSLYCDNEAQDVAKYLGKYKYMGDHRILFRHLHPSFGLGSMDEQYQKTEAHEIRLTDEQTYRRRKANNFDL